MTPAAVCIIFSLVMSVVAFVATQNLLFLIATFVVYFVVLILLIKPSVKSYLEKQNRYHECYKFIHSFIINLSVTNSIDKAYESGIKGLTGELLEVVKALDDNPRNITYYLTNYFEFDSYKMFTSILLLYEEEGGDILTLSRNLLLEVSRNEESQNIRKKDGIHCLKEFITMWVMAIVILLFIRFALLNFYDYLRTNIVYLVGVGAFLGFFLLSICVYTVTYCGFKTQKAKTAVKEKR